MTEVKITAPNWAPKYIRRKLKRKYMLHESEYQDHIVYAGKLSKFRINSIKRFIYKVRKTCRLAYSIDNSFGKRSATYRKEYFAHNKPIYGKFYRCVYCGTLHTRKNITVDHIYPVKKVNESTYFQEKLKKKGAESVNSYKNLVAACRRCNSKKSANMGLWIPRAYIGSIKGFWFVVHIIMIAVTVILIIWCCRNIPVEIIQNAGNLSTAQ